MLNTKTTILRGLVKTTGLLSLKASLPGRETGAWRARIGADDRVVGQGGAGVCDHSICQNQDWLGVRQREGGRLFPTIEGAFLFVAFFNFERKHKLIH